MNNNHSNDENKIYKFIPYKKIDNINFGDNRKKIIKLIGKAKTTGKVGFPRRNHTVDVYGNINISYDPKKNVEQVNIFPDNLNRSDCFIEYNDIKIKLTTVVEDFIEKLKELTDDISEQYESGYFIGYCSTKLGIAVYCPENYIESISFCTEQFYNNEIINDFDGFKKTIKLKY